MGPLEKMDIGGREEVDNCVARCVYACDISFNVVCSPYWEDMGRAINDGPKGYKSPSFEKIPTTLLTKEKSLVEQTIEPIKASQQTTNVSIVSKGWTDARNRPLINVIVASPKGLMFLNAMDCNGELKDATFIANILIDAIESVGPSNVVQVITDNAREIEMFITNHNMAQAIYRQFASLELLKVVETQFTSHVVTLSQLLEVKSSLCNNVISDVWNI
eukprot:Gb_39398 [translate_table: standard]